MLKRAELARAFAVKPEILYMDEPFSALDALTNLRCAMNCCAFWRRSATRSCDHHDVEEAIHLADRIMVLSPRPREFKRCSRSICRIRAD